MFSWRRAHSTAAAPPASDGDESAPGPRSTNPCRPGTKDDASAPTVRPLPAQGRGLVPLELHDGLGPPRRRARIARRPRWRRHRSAALGLVGIAGVVAGLALALAAPPPTAWVDPAGYHLGGTVLRDQGGGVFGNSAQGVIVIKHSDDGTVRAGASLTYAGQKVSGDCILRGTAEHCVLRTSGDTIVADDRLTVSGSSAQWDRRYSDGRTTTIVISHGSAVPVPVPVGR
jgi:hypothetical protein